MPGTLIPTNPKLDIVYDVLIDETGKFNYILCKVCEAEKPQEFKYIVRGTARADFHSDIYDELDAQLEEYGLACECLGGGQLLHNSQDRQMEVYGKSQGYGKANHALTVEILRRKFPDYSITWYDD